MSGLGRAGALAWRGLARLVPAGRREWVEAVWAEAAEVPPGPRRLAWRAGGVWLIAREAVMVRRIGGLLLFAAAVVAAARVAWPGSPDTVFAPVARADVVTMVALLLGLPLLARWFFGPPASRAARWLRLGCYASLLALLPIVNAVEQFSYTPPRGSADLRVYLLIANPAHHAPGGTEIIILLVAGLYIAAVLWMTSQRSGVAPVTLVAGVGAGIALGLVVYAVAPLGLSREATNPWLPGSDIDPLMVLAWLLLPGASAVATLVADRHYTGLGSPPPSDDDRVRQATVAALLTGMTGALFAGGAGFATTLAMVKAAWLRDWLYHGHHLLYGVANLSADLRTPSVIAYSHELTGSVDSGAFFAMPVVFPLITLTGALWVALRASGGTAAGSGGIWPDGGEPGPEPAPDPPASGRPAGTHDRADLTVGVPGAHDPGQGSEQDRLVAAPR